MSAEVQARRRLITWDDVMGMVPLSRPTVYRMIREGAFPPPVQISAGRSAFFEDEVLAWFETRQRGVLPINPHARRVSSGGG